MSYIGNRCAVDQYGCMYVITHEHSSGHHCGIRKYDDEGNYMGGTSSIRAKGKTTVVNEIEGIAVDSQGNIFLACVLTGATTTANRNTGFVMKLDDEFHYVDRKDVSDYFATSNIGSLAVDEYGMIYVGGDGRVSGASMAVILDDELNVYKDLGTSV